MKRFFDVVASGIGLILLSPLFIILTIWIKCDSTGSVFYRQIRVGRNNRDFQLLKFRSMRVGSDKKGLITVGGRDPRITRSGYYICKYKLDELVAFRVPYYVGPLITSEQQQQSSNKKFAWMIRKAEGKITPWNFDEKVDRQASANEFIKRMTTTDTY